MSDLLIFSIKKSYIKHTKKQDFRFFKPNFFERSDHLLISSERITHGRSFVLSDLSDSLTVAHLSWAIWANCSQSLIWFERIPSPENQSNKIAVTLLNIWLCFSKWTLLLFNIPVFLVEYISKWFIPGNSFLGQCGSWNSWKYFKPGNSLFGTVWLLELHIHSWYLFFYENYSPYSGYAVD